MLKCIMNSEFEAEKHKMRLKSQTILTRRRVLSIAWDGEAAPKLVVIPITSISGLRNAASNAIPASGNRERIRWKKAHTHEEAQKKICILFL